MGHPPTMRTLACFAFTLSAVGTLGAQDFEQSESKPATLETKWRHLGEIGIGSAENKVIATGIEYAKALIAAGVRDGEGENWACRMFLTPESLAAAPLKFKFLREAGAARLTRSPFLQFDYQKKIDFGEMFAPMRPMPLDIPGGYDVKGMLLAPVLRPGGGYRMNFGHRGKFGAKPTENEVLTKFHEFQAPAPNERLMQRLRQLPVYVQMDTRPLMSERESQRISALFGPKGGLLSGSITSMGNRPVVDAYSGIGPGEGVVGQYLDRVPRMGVVLGSLNFEPGLLIAADLGKLVPRSLLTLLNAAPESEKAAVDTVRGLLESWDGRITVAGAGVEPPAKLGDTIDIDKQFERLAGSLHGTVLFGLEDDSAAEIVRDIEAFLSGPAAKQTGLPVEVVEDGRRRAFRVAGQKVLSFGAGKRIVAIGVANTLARSCSLRDGSLQAVGAVRAPRKFTMVNGPVKMWAHKGLLRYLGLWFRGLDDLFGRSVENRVGWIRRTLEDELLRENLAASLTWDRRFGTMLRLMF